MFEGHELNPSMVTRPITSFQNIPSITSVALHTEHVWTIKYHPPNGINRISEHFMTFLWPNYPPSTLHLLAVCVFISCSESPHLIGLHDWITRSIQGSLNSLVPKLHLSQSSCSVLRLCFMWKLVKQKYILRWLLQIYRCILNYAHLTICD